MEYKRKFHRRQNIPDVQIEMIHDGKSCITKLVPFNLKVFLLFRYLVIKTFPTFLETWRQPKVLRDPKLSPFAATTVAKDLTHTTRPLDILPYEVVLQPVCHGYAALCSPPLWVHCLWYHVYEEVGWQIKFGFLIFLYIPGVFFPSFIK